jgi:hypothetical protein
VAVPGVGRRLGTTTVAVAVGAAVAGEAIVRVPAAATHRCHCLLSDIEHDNGPRDEKDQEDRQ